MMKAQLLSGTKDDEYTYVLVFDKGDELIENLKRFAEEHGVFACHFTAIGAFQRATLGYFDRDMKDYIKIPINEQVEVLSLVGDISGEYGKPKIHAHVVIGKRDGTAHGGHVLEAIVWPTLEVILEETPKHLGRKYDPETGLSLIDLEQSDSVQQES